jgi:hypothetical protein
LRRGALERTRSALHNTLTRACAAARIPEPPLFASNLILASKKGQNVAQAAETYKHHPWRLGSSTMSDGMREANLPAFLQTANLQVGNDTVRVLNQYPPDPGTLVIILDEHQEEYHMERAYNGDGKPARARTARGLIRLHDSPCRRPNCRCPTATVAHSDNKASKWASNWLIIILAWRHQGQQIIRLLHIRYLFGLDRSSKVQAEILARLVRRHRLKVAVAVGDRAYGSREFRQILRQAGIPSCTRLKDSHHGPHGRTGRKLILQSGQVIDLRKLQLDLANDPAVPVESWQDPRTKELRVTKSWTGTGRFLDSEDEYEVHVRVGLEKDPKKPGKWRRIEAHSIVLVFTPGFGARVMRSLFTQRWKIEVFFHLWSLERPKPKPQMLQSLIIQFVAFVLRVALAQLHQTLIHLAYALHPELGSPPAYYTLPLAARDVLRPDTRLGVT